MGWYGSSKIKCPKCKKENAEEMFRNSGDETYLLICTNCGLHLHCEEKLWVVTNSYIDKSIIGKNPDKFELDTLVDRKKNEDIFPSGLALDGYYVKSEDVLKKLSHYFEKKG